MGGTQDHIIKIPEKIPEYLLSRFRKLVTFQIEFSLFPGLFVHEFHIMFHCFVNFFPLFLFHAKEKIREFDRLFALEERWSGQLECYYMSLYQRYQEKYGDGEMSLEKLKEYLEEDIKRNQIIQNWQPGRYLEGEYMKWIANKQLKAFYEELKK